MSAEPQEYPDDDNEYDADIDEDCDHLDYELDILIGRAICDRCGHMWYMSEAELKHDEEMRMMPYPGEDEPND